jgi:hypothetical protein
MALAALLALPLRAGAEDPVRIVMLPIVVHSSVSDSSYVSRGLADMLSARLEQVGGIVVVREDAMATATARLEHAYEAGREADGDYVIFGAFTQFGDGASLDVQCAPLGVSGLAEAAAGRRIFVQSGTMGDIIPKLDQMVDKIAYFLSGPEDAEALAAAAPSARGPGAGPAASESVAELRDRIEALERAVYEGIGVPEEASAAVAPAEEPIPES